MSETLLATREEFGKRAVRFALTVVGLLLLKGLLSVLPMLKNATAIGNTLLSPLVLTNGIVDVLILVAILTFGFGLSRALRQSYPRVPDLGTVALLVTVLLILVLAYNLLELPIACVVVSPQDLFAAKVGDIPYQFANVLGQLDRGVSQEMTKLASGSTLEAYQKIAVASIRQPPDLYGWIFLILSAIPVVGIVILGSRNLDRITELVFHKAKVATVGSSQGTASAIALEGRCSNCGQTTAVHTKFCPNCGTALIVPTATACKCSSCGTENASGARFCKECGQAA